MIVGFYDNDKKLGAGDPIYSLEMTEDEYWFIEKAHDAKVRDEMGSDYWDPPPKMPFLFLIFTSLTTSGQRTYWRRREPPTRLTPW